MGATLNTLIGAVLAILTSVTGITRITSAILNGEIPGGNVARPVHSKLQEIF